MKKTITLLLAVLLVVSLLPLGAAAANGEKLIALTYDDGPSQYTAQLLDGLKARGAHVTFFCVGYQVQARPQIVRRAWMEGHQIGNHTWDHPQLTKQGWSGVQSQLGRTDAALDSAIGFDQTYDMRPPYGDYNQSVLNAAGVPAFYWSMDTADYKTNSASVVCNQIVKAARDGGICCIHDTHLSTVQGSLQAIDILQRQGYQFVTLEEMFYRRGITLQSGTIYFNAYPGSTADKLTAPVIYAGDGPDGKVVSFAGDSRTTIYYTTDGSEPTPVNSIRYTGPFTVTRTCTIRAVGVVKWNGLRTATASRTVDYIPCVAPTLTLGEGGVIRMSTTTPNAQIRYTTDDSPAQPTSAVYDDANPPAAVKGTTYRAVTTAQGYYPSTECILTYSASGFFMRDVTVDDWFYAAIDRAMAEGLVNGVSPEYMAPNAKLTRAMLVTLLYRAAKPDTAAPAATFADTTAADWYAEALNWAIAQGVVKGYPDGTFRPDNSITREELCVMLQRWLATRGITGDGTDAVSAFADAASVADWSRDGVNTVCALGIVKGYEDNTVRPQGTATRAEAVTMLLRAVDLPDPEPTTPEQPADPVIPIQPIEPVGPIDPSRPEPDLPTPVPTTPVTE